MLFNRFGDYPHAHSDARKNSYVSDEVPSSAALRELTPTSYRIINDQPRAEAADRAHGAAAGRQTDEPTRPKSLVAARPRSVAAEPPMSLPPAAPAAQDEPAAGDVVSARYQLISLLGRGGMGDVWRARSFRLEIDVALKLVRRDCAVPNARERLQREARLAARVVHPAAVRVLDHDFTADDAPYLVMELLRGQSLRQKVAQSGPMSPIAAVRLMLPIVGALGVVHREGIVHRDVKPGNVVIVEDGGIVIPKLIDFGIACPVPLSPPRGEAGRLTGYGMSMGSPQYMAPEQLRRGGAPDVRTDIWGVCTTLAEIVSGLSCAEDPSSALMRLETHTKRSQSGAPVADRRFFEIVARGLAIAPEDRYPTINALGSALAEWALANGAMWDVTRTWLATYCLPACAG